MKILAIETAALVASVAVIEDNDILAEFNTNYKKTHSETIMPMLDNMLTLLEIDIKDMDAIAISAGPGSFTGLRIGAATAKGLAYAIGKPLISIPTLEAMANTVAIESDYILAPIMDARRNQVYSGLYKQQGGKLIALREDKAVEVTDLIEELRGYKEKILLLGDGVPVYSAEMIEKLPDRIIVALPHLCRQRAAALAQLAVEYYKQGRCVKPEEFEPNYCRLAQAERELKEKTNVAD